MRPELIMLDEDVVDGIRTATAVLIHEDTEYQGIASGASDVRNRLEVVCEATLKAAAALGTDAVSLHFAGVVVTDVRTRPIALALVERMDTHDVLIGTARVKSDGVTKAAARAVMDAVNRTLFRPA